ncbi:MerR family DNA-binding protein [Arthrobacter castelli]|uniref:MerR family DNA-binding protein n=1 Tax=Arthrobacter castelli TaxID=271431 RepID=UPI00040E0F57|nr:MerR family DNA-binding protein [Arthrobacter castelli]
MRSSGGHRLYDVDDVTKVRIIKAAQRLGFTLDEVIGLLEVSKRRHGADSCRDAARDKLADVERRRADLQVIASTLRETIAAECTDLQSCAAAVRCPIPFEGADHNQPL